MNVFKAHHWKDGTEGFAEWINMLPLDESKLLQYIGLVKEGGPFKDHCRDGLILVYSFPGHEEVHNFSDIAAYLDIDYKEFYTKNLNGWEYPIDQVVKIRTKNGSPIVALQDNFSPWGFYMSEDTYKELLLINIAHNSLSQTGAEPLDKSSFDWLAWCLSTSVSKMDPSQAIVDAIIERSVSRYEDLCNANMSNGEIIDIVTSELVKDGLYSLLRDEIIDDIADEINRKLDSGE